MPAPYSGDRASIAKSWGSVDWKPQVGVFAFEPDRAVVLGQPLVQPQWDVGQMVVDEVMNELVIDGAERPFFGRSIDHQVVGEWRRNVIAGHAVGSAVRADLEGSNGRFIAEDIDPGRRAGGDVGKGGGQHLPHLLQPISDLSGGSPAGVAEEREVLGFDLDPGGANCDLG
jgi:hypothetical protein